MRTILAKSVFFAQLLIVLLIVIGCGSRRDAKLEQHFERTAGMTEEEQEDADDLYHEENN
jgi:hypothetical protein